jgi:two-component system sensor histidine kinase KdpD
VNNLLEMTRLDSGQVEVHREWHPIEEIAGAALHRLEHVLRDREIHVAIPRDLPLVSIDDVLMEQVFINLLENAAKYTPAGSPVELAAWPDRDTVVMEVRDRGQGFPPGEEERVFEKFFRGKAGGVRGAGLGLAICRAIVAAHHGTISAQNRVEGGALIRIVLPIGGSPPAIEPSVEEIEIG